MSKNFLLLKKIGDLCDNYGLWSGADNRDGWVLICSGISNTKVVGLVWLNDEWETIERRVVELAMTQSFGV